MLQSKYIGNILGKKDKFRLQKLKKYFESMENNSFTLLHFWTTHFKNSDKLRDSEKKQNHSLQDKKLNPIQIFSFAKRTE